MSDPASGRRMDWRPLEASSNPNESTNLCWNCVPMLCRACTFRHNASRKTRETSGILKTCCTNDLRTCSKLNAFTVLWIVCTYADQKNCICLYLFSHVTDRGPTEHVLQKPLQSYLTHWARKTEQPQPQLILIHLLALQLWGGSQQNQKLIIKKKRLQVQHGWYNSPEWWNKNCS